jgi:hypothetical protein
MAYATRKAKRVGTRVCMAVMGPSGGGKTVGSLILAKELGKKIVLIETQPGQSDYYGNTFDFFVKDLKSPYTPERCIAILREAVEVDKADVVIFDSLSHEWVGKGGVLQMVEDTPGVNSFSKWKQPSRAHGEFIETFTSLARSAHFIATIRAKDKYVIDKNVDPQTGKEKSVPRKLGAEPIQRDGIEYEFPIVLMLEPEGHTFRVWQDKTNGVFKKDKKRVITAELGKKLATWCKGANGYEPLAELEEEKDEEEEENEENGEDPKKKK